MNNNRKILQAKSVASKQITINQSFKQALYPYSVVQWPNKKDGLLFGIVKTANLSKYHKDKNGKRFVFVSLFNREYQSHLVSVGSYNECFDRFQLLSDGWRCSRSDSNEPNLPGRLFLFVFNNNH